MTTQSQITEQYENTIPQTLREQFTHLTFGEMADRQECAEYADVLRAMDAAWYEADDA